MRYSRIDREEESVKIDRLHQVALAARDLDGSVAFWRDRLGARLIGRFDPPGLAFFDLSGTRLLVERAARPATIYLWVDDIDAAYGELSRIGVSFDGPPHAVHRDEPGQFGPAGETEWMAFFRDPGDNIVALATRRR
jgi:catechol 2,3-dioxygenase-like lactoylglutathione lyase family enzyme